MFFCYGKQQGHYSVQFFPARKRIESDTSSKHVLQKFVRDNLTFPTKTGELAFYNMIV